LGFASLESCCFWSDWINEDHPNSGSDGGDRETFDGVCRAPEDIECRSVKDPHLSLEEVGQKVQCDVSVGFICKNEDQFENGPFGLCYDYMIRVHCCLPTACTTTAPPTTTPSPPTTTTTTPPPTTTSSPPTTTTTTTPSPTTTTTATPPPTTTPIPPTTTPSPPTTTTTTPPPTTTPSPPTTTTTTPPPTTTT
ncbi:PREDICTED: mucin-2-like, partial [Rhinopithecus bieti]|uniref:mucin-2-like n=1 Tax=Rhinopithecus bieti TaxID=61621 RepID=UPI00083C8B7B